MDPPSLALGGGATPTLPGGRGHFHTSLPSIPESSCQPGPRIMSLVLPTLLYLGESGQKGGHEGGSVRLGCAHLCFLPGLYLTQSSWVQEGEYSL